MSSAKKTISARERLGRNLRSYREAQGWSQENLAAQAGLTQTFLSQMENGLTNVSLDNIERLAEALNLDIGELLKL
ncbi:helix-turn-helix domain-containing protein [Noviherbaspirillum sp. UKPF54]|uniref:helix-turn-helix domain-containing protein n=1 Tax=Noviherbaspirillum sp. UKPF54 TaxID=2601898 RepID=UPI0011B1ACA9|nr:helix-turn-helix transcriptional regulator [Noviherbaspirillum sp. UKPF54]QDZ30108.1 helix-turn-helix transcriptional regulator [Noviherbaspirillum sp. UKPF54]